MRWTVLWLGTAASRRRPRERSRPMGRHRSSVDERADEPRNRAHLDVGTEIPEHKLKWDRGNPTGRDQVCVVLRTAWPRLIGLLYRPLVDEGALSRRSFMWLNIQVNAAALVSICGLEIPRRSKSMRHLGGPRSSALAFNPGRS
jgi:hypothetical protein